MNSKTSETIERIDTAVQNTADRMSASSSGNTRKANRTIKEMQQKKEDLRKDMTAGYRKIKKDIHKTNNNISKDMKAL